MMPHHFQHLHRAMLQLRQLLLLPVLRVLGQVLLSQLLLVPLLLLLLLLLVEPLLLLPL
jgi:hypothetical protein